MENYKTRNDVPEKYKWDLTDFFKDINEFNIEADKVSKQINLISNYIGCTEDSDRLFEYIEFSNELSSNILNLAIYAMLINDQDLSKSDGVECVGKISNIETEYMVKSSFFEPELLKLSNEDFNKLFNNKKLLKYKELLNDIYRYKEHVLPKEEEELVSLLTQTAENYSQMSSTLLNSNHDYGEVIMEDGTKEKLMSTNYRRLMKKCSREKRKDIYIQFNKVIDRYASTNASLLDGYVKTNVILSKIHKYKSTWDQKLFDLELSDKVFDSLTKVAIDKKNILKKFYDLKSRVLNINKCLPWDSPIELYKINKEYTIEEAQDIILNSLKPLGDDYINHFKNVFDDRCIDYCQYKGKCSGGYNVSSTTIKNSKILMSFNYDLESISTISHEGGHHVHHQYIYENNIDVYRNIPNIVAEVASLTNEFLLSYYLSNSDDKEEALVGLSNIIGVFVSNFFGAVQEADMEREFYKYVEAGGTLTKDYLDKLSEESIIKFYPKEKLDHEYEKNLWTKISHYFMFYYLFSYAVCVSVASYVSNEILSGNKEMLDKYMKFLKTGNDVKIIDIFKILGINLEEENVYIKAVDNFELLLNKFNKLYSD